MEQGTLLSVTSDDVREAADRIGPYGRTTPVFTTEIGGRPVTLKLENLQVTGSFKFRGALNGVIARLGLDRPVVAVGPQHCNSLHAAFSAGRPVDAPVDSAAASALGASRIGQNAFALLSSGKVQLALVIEREIAHARDLLWEELRLAVEPAAAPAWSFAARTPTGIRCSRTDLRCRADRDP